jgi:hypothetical protein
MDTAEKTRENRLRRVARRRGFRLEKEQEPRSRAIGYGRYCIPPAQREDRLGGRLFPKRRGCGLTGARCGSVSTVTKSSNGRPCGSTAAMSITSPIFDRRGQAVAAHHADGRGLQGRIARKGVSPATARKILTSLKIAITEAQRRGLVAQNVAADVRYGKRKRHPIVEGEDFPSKPELQAILANAGRWYPLLVTAAFTGMRSSELRGLRWGDIGFDGRAVHVRRSAAHHRRSEIGGRDPHDPADRSGRAVMLGTAVRLTQVIPAIGNVLSSGCVGRPRGHETGLTGYAE